MVVQRTPNPLAEVRFLVGPPMVNKIGEFFKEIERTFLVLFFIFVTAGVAAILLPRLPFQNPSSQTASVSNVATTTKAVPKIEPLPPGKELFPYIEVTSGCGIHYEGTCINVRSGPGTDFPVVHRLRTGIVLKVAGIVNRDGTEWYKIAQDDTLRYPERVQGDWYVYAPAVDLLFNDGDHHYVKGKTATTTKRIVIDRGKEMLYAYDGDTLFMKTPISTGLEFTPTPRGTFTVYTMTPSRYMQGPLPGLPSDQYYDLPGVPWNLYFTQDGAVIHGAYWHDSFGQPYSHGCVNLPLDKAKELYLWADIGMTVTVTD